MPLPTLIATIWLTAALVVACLIAVDLRRHRKAQRSLQAAQRGAETRRGGVDWVSHSGSE